MCLHICYGQEPGRDTCVITPPSGPFRAWFRHVYLHALPQLRVTLGFGHTHARYESSVAQQNSQEPRCLTCEILALSVNPVVACAALHHLAVVVVVLVALEADGAVVTWRGKQLFCVSARSGCRKSRAVPHRLADAFMQSDLQ